MGKDNSKKPDNTEERNEFTNNTVVENKNNIKTLISKLFTTLTTVAFPVILALNKPVDYYMAIKSENLYGVPNSYFFDNTEYVLLFKIIMLILIVGIFFIPYLLNKSRELYWFKITKMDSIAYAFIISFYSFFLFFYLIITIFQAINYASYFALFISLFTPTIVSIVLFKTIKDYLDLYTKSLVIKNDNGKDKPDDRYKYITFDFNGAENNFEQKVRVQILVGSKLSEAVKYISTDKIYSKVKKNEEKLSYWTDEKDSNSKYKDVIITEDFEDEKVLYARYSNKKYKDDNIKINNYFIFATAIVLTIIITLLVFSLSENNPENKTVYEIVTMDDGMSKIKVCDYKDNAVLMDFKYSISDKNTKKQTENIEIIKGKYIVESIEGKPIQLKNFKNVTVVEETNNEESDK